MEKRLDELYRLIRLYDASYYGKNESLISDAGYDLLYRELQELEHQFPHLIDPDSPTKRIASDSSEGFEKVEHTIPMMSIDNTYSYQDLCSWIERIGKQCKGHQPSFIGELKMDGVAVALHYRDGRLLMAVTRGDGKKGDDVTTNVRAIRSIPLTIDSHKPLEIRGEIYMTFQHFQELNERLLLNGEQPMQNPRNTVAGTIKLLNPQEVSDRKLSFAAHFLISPSHEHLQRDNLYFMETLGFPTVKHSESLYTPLEIQAFLEYWNQHRQHLAYPIDGIVFKVDQIPLHALIGTTAKSPRWVIAFKYPSLTAQTTVLAIDSQVGRTGVVTPVARLEPVLLSGSTIKNATLHNFEEIKRLSVTIGDEVEIEKSGEVIPKIIRVTKKNSPHESYFEPPHACPSCGVELIHSTDEVALRCINTSCPAQLFASIVHFVSREALNIEGLGPAMLDKLLKHNLIHTPADIFSITAEDLEAIERMGQKSITNLFKSIEQAKKQPIHRLIFGLGIRQVGAQTAKLLSQKITAIEDLYTFSIADMSKIETIGPSIAASIYAYFSQSCNRELIQKLRMAGVNCDQSHDNHDDASKPLKGQIFVITGTLSSLNRAKAQEHLEHLGATIASSVTKKTSVVIAGKDSGSKEKKALDLGIKILDEEQFIALLSSFHHTIPETL